MERIILASTDEMATAVADRMVELIETTLQHKDRFTLVLSGGSTPRKLFELLATPEYKDRIIWKSVHFFWGDERFVPFTDERNNAKMAFDALIDHIPATHEQIHVMRTDFPADESSVAYDEILHDYFGENPTHSFDLVLLGMGGDGHTLSLFPGYPIVHEKEKWVDAFYLEEQNMYRITLTAAIVNKAHSIFFLVAGSDKSAALKQVMEGERNLDLYPAQLIQPEDGEVSWFLDEKAASLIE